MELDEVESRTEKRAGQDTKAFSVQILFQMSQIYLVEKVFNNHIKVQI